MMRITRAYPFHRPPTMTAEDAGTLALIARLEAQLRAALRAGDRIAAISLEQRIAALRRS
jgi:hypothetical protein